MTQAALQTENFISSSQGEIETIAVRPGYRGTIIDEAIRKHCQPSIDRTNSRMTVEELLYLLNAELAQLFLAIQDGEIVGIVITEIVEYVSGAKCLKVIILGGKGALAGGMDAMIKTLEEFAMLSICSTIQCEGRKGWGRVLPDGYRYSHTVFLKELF